MTSIDPPPGHKKLVAGLYRPQDTAVFALCAWTYGYRVGREHGRRSVPDRWTIAFHAKQRFAGRVAEQSQCIESSTPQRDTAWAMSEENVELVRGFYESLDRWLASYWSDPVVPIEQSPELEEMFDLLDAEAERDWLFSPETFRGREQLLQALADYLETVGDWRVEWRS